MNTKKDDHETNKVLFEDMPNAKDVISRLKKALDITRDIDLAGLLGVSKVTISGWRKRNSIPYEHCIKISKEHDISLDWIIKGEEIIPLVPKLHFGGLDKDIIAIQLKRLDFYKEEKEASGEDFEGDDIWFRASMFASWYRGDFHMIREIASKGKMTKKEIVDAIMSSMTSVYRYSYELADMFPEAAGIRDAGYTEDESDEEILTETDKDDSQESDNH